MISRRDMLRIGATTAASIGTVAAGVALYRHGRHAGRASLPKIRDHRVAQSPQAPQMVIVHGADPAANVRRALTAIGGMERFVKKGERVVVKPNVAWNRLPEQGANTHPAVLAEVVRHVVAAGASAIWVADVSVNTPERCFARSGIHKAAVDAGASVLLPTESGFREIDVAGKILQLADVFYPFVDADKVINVPTVKQHGLSKATLSMKNWYGVLGGQRVKLHQQLHLSIVDLAAMMKPTLTIMDATRILMSNGPTGGNLADVKGMDTVAVGTDEVALDAFGASLLGLAPGDVGFIIEAEKAGLGRSDYKSLRLEEIGS